MAAFATLQLALLHAPIALHGSAGHDERATFVIRAHLNHERGVPQHKIALRTWPRFISWLMSLPCFLLLLTAASAQLLAATRCTRMRCYCLALVALARFSVSLGVKPWC